SVAATCRIGGEVGRQRNLAGTIFIEHNRTGDGGGGRRDWRRSGGQRSGGGGDGGGSRGHGGTGGGRSGRRYGTAASCQDEDEAEEEQGAGKLGEHAATPSTNYHFFVDGDCRTPVPPLGAASGGMRQGGGREGQAGHAVGSI